MAQTMYAHRNKWINKPEKESLMTFKPYDLWITLLYKKQKLEGIKLLLLYRLLKLNESISIEWNECFSCAETLLKSKVHFEAAIHILLICSIGGL
jgi:hypothetical protein